MKQKRRDSYSLVGEANEESSEFFRSLRADSLRWNAFPLD
jgi:hypothetical protein